MLNENIIFIGVIINLIFTFFYIRSIFHGSTRPNLVSWFMWSLAPFVGVFLQFKAGAGFSVLGTFMSGFLPLLVLILSFFKKHYFWKLTTFDLFCGLISLFSLIIYILTRNISLAIIFAILSDALAYIPTYRKVWFNPKSENYSIYLGGIINNILALLIVKNWIFSIYIFSVYLVLVNILLILVIYRKQIFRKITNL